MVQVSHCCRYVMDFKKLAKPGTSFVSMVSGTAHELGKPEVPHTAKMGGLVIGAPPAGLVFVDGVWRPYVMVQGQMVIQAPGSCDDYGLSVAAPAFVPTSVAADGIPPPPPPPYPPRTATPTTPTRRPNAGCNATPGGTPVPPPPPSTPLRSAGVSGSPGAGPGEVESQASWSQSCHLWLPQKGRMRRWWQEIGWLSLSQAWQA